MKHRTLRAAVVLEASVNYDEEPASQEVKKYNSHFRKAKNVDFGGWGWAKSPLDLRTNITRRRYFAFWNPLF